MEKTKKSYMKPTISVIPAGTSKYNEIMALWKADDSKANGKNIPPPDKQE